MSLYYTTFEAARLLGVSLPTVVNWIKARRIKAHRTPGGHRRISSQDLASFMLLQGIPLPEELSGATSARRKVLVVAEAGPAREGSARQLAQAGFAVEQASPGFRAGAAAARFLPEAVVLHASQRDGGETLRDLRSDRDLSKIPIVALAPGDWADDLRAAGATPVEAPPGEGLLGKAVSNSLGSTDSTLGSGKRQKKRRSTT